MPRLGTIGSGADTRYFIEQDSNPIEITGEQYQSAMVAKQLNPLEAGMLSMADRVMNSIRKAGITDADMGIKPGAMSALNEAHPTATAIGSVAPYLAAVPATIASGGTLPAAMAIGAGTGALLADEGDTLRDAIIGGGTPLIGGAVAKGAQVLKGGMHKFYKPVTVKNKTGGNKTTVQQEDTRSKTDKILDNLYEANKVDYGIAGGRAAVPGLFDVIWDEKKPFKKD